MAAFAPICDKYDMPLALDQQRAAPPVSAEIKALVETHQEPVILLGLDYRIIYANRAYRSSYSDGEPLSQQHCYQVSHGYSLPCDRAGELCPLLEAFDSGQTTKVMHVHQTPRGDEHCEVTTYPVRDESGEIVYFLEHLHRIDTAATRVVANDKMVGKSAAFNRMLEMIGRVAATDTTALLVGESGTGKELVARAIHDQSPRSKAPFIPVDCSGLPESLFESELFGHVKGAFTGASTRKTGLVEAAEGGTLFLDEIGDIPLAQQVKLLRLIETSTYRPVGSVQQMKANFRLVCATHRDLKNMVEREEFRSDLFYRISAFTIELPSLCERREDIVLLAETMLQRSVRNRVAPKLSAAAKQCLRNHHYPGNIRELRNIIEHAVLLTDGDTVLPQALPNYVQCSNKVNRVNNALGSDELVPLDELEKHYLEQAVLRHTGDRKALAKELGISERTLYRKLQKINLQ